VRAQGVLVVAETTPEQRRDEDGEDGMVSVFSWGLRLESNVSGVEA
jgi:hypothetical protein